MPLKDGLQVGQVATVGCEVRGEEWEPEGPWSSRASGVKGGKMKQAIAGRGGDVCSQFPTTQGH